MSQLVRLEGKHTTQNAHCALRSLQSKTTEIDFRESTGAGQERGRCAASCDWGSSDLISSKGPPFASCQENLWKHETLYCFLMNRGCGILRLFFCQIFGKKTNLSVCMSIGKLNMFNISERFLRCRAPIILSLWATVTTLYLNWSSALGPRARYFSSSS